MPVAQAGKGHLWRKRKCPRCGGKMKPRWTRTATTGRYWVWECRACFVALLPRWNERRPEGDL